MNRDDALYEAWKKKRLGSSWQYEIKPKLVEPQLNIEISDKAKALIDAFKDAVRSEKTCGWDFLALRHKELCEYIAKLEEGF